MTEHDEQADRPAVTGAPVGGESRAEAITGDDAGGGYPADRVSPDRGGSAPRDEAGSA